jgi:hypothetical protein
MFMKIEKLSKKNNQEDVTNTPTDSQLTAINNQISQIYNMDVEAIRNLGAISKSLLTGTNYHTTTPTTPGTLTIPADNTNFKGNISANNLQINSGGYVRNGDGTIWPNGDITVGSVRLQSNGAITSGSLTTHTIRAQDVYVGHTRVWPNGDIVVGNDFNCQLTGSGNATFKGKINTNEINTNRINVPLINGERPMHTKFFWGNHTSWATMRNQLEGHMRGALPPDSVCFGIFQNTDGYGSWCLCGALISGNFSCSRFGDSGS